MPTNNKGKRFSAARPQAPATDDYGHLQPQAPELEKVVLGALMIEKDAYSLISEILRPEVFTNRATNSYTRPYASSTSSKSRWTFSQWPSN